MIRENGAVAGVAGDDHLDDGGGGHAQFAHRHVLGNLAEYRLPASGAQINNTIARAACHRVNTAAAGARLPDSHLGQKGGGINGEGGNICYCKQGGRRMNSFCNGRGRGGG